MLGLLEKFVPPYALGVAGKIPAPVDLGGAPNVGPVLDRPLARLGAANLCSSSRGSGAAVATFLPCAAVAVVAAFSPRIVLSFAARARAATSFRSRATEPARTSRRCHGLLLQPHGTASLQSAALGEFLTGLHADGRGKKGGERQRAGVCRHLPASEYLRALLPAKSGRGAADQPSP